MRYGLIINTDPPVWIDDAVFLVISLVAGRGQSIATLSAGGRISTGAPKIWVDTSLKRGDSLSIIRRDKPTLSDEHSNSPPRSLPDIENGKISAFQTSMGESDEASVSILDHDVLQAVGSWDQTSNLFKLEINAVTSKADGYIEEGDGFSLQQTFEDIRPITITIT